MTAGARAYPAISLGGGSQQFGVDAETQSRTFLVVGSGPHQQLAAFGDFGRVIRKNHLVAIANQMGVPAAETLSVVDTRDGADPGPPGVHDR
ncbi:hypothetical protein [Streptomyces sp. NPDC088254]|uniref:hypothetical protein n=1 Tax=Streptomyces sp. NPDC088254 TaxID=3365847 RepID=UPI00380B62C1